MGICYSKRLIRSSVKPDTYTLIHDDNFTQTSDLEKALNPFLSCGKGLHVAFICQDEKIAENQIIALFENIYKKIQADSVKNCSWKDGHYIGYSQQESMLAAIQYIIGCMNILGKDVTNAQKCLQTMVVFNNGQQEYNLPLNHVWNLKFVQVVSESLLTEDEAKGECADIRILVLLPKSCFELFTKEDCRFPYFIDFVIKGISETHKLEAFNNFNKIIETIKAFYENKGERIDDSLAEHIAIEVKKDFASKNNLKNNLDIITTERFDEIKGTLERFLDEIQLMKPNALYSYILARNTQNENSLMQNSMPKDTRGIMSDEPDR